MPIRIKLDELVQVREMSTRDLAIKAGLAYNTVLGLRRGSIQQIRFSTLDKLCEALGVRPGDIFEYSEPAAPVGLTSRRKTR